MAASESLLFKASIPVLRMVGVWLFLQRRNKSKLCRLFRDLATDYSGAPKKSEDMYATLIVLFRYTLIRESNKITVSAQNFSEIEAIKTLHGKCNKLFSTQQNRAIHSILEKSNSINEGLSAISLNYSIIVDPKIQTPI